MMTLRRRAAAVLPAALIATALTLPGASARADEGPAELVSPAEAAATWAVGKLTDGTHASADHGLTADIVMGLAAAGTAGDTAGRATDWLAAHAGDYINRGVPDAVNAGGTAKLALVAAIENRDLSDFGGHDLAGLLRDRVQDTGRFSDAGPSGDMSNQFTQSLGVLALERTAEGAPESTVEFLASTRCADGGYPLSLRRNPDRCTADTDSTGMAVQALLAAGRTADAEPGLDWLEAQQQESGGWGYNAASAANSNSTALAVQALIGGGRAEAAERGTSWLRGMQVGCSAAEGDRGAVGYMEPVADGMALRATAQVIPALAGVPLGDIDGSGGVSGVAPVACAPGGGDGGSGGAGAAGGAGGAVSGAAGTTVSGGGDTGGDTSGADAGGAGDAVSGGADAGADSGADGGADAGTGGAASGDAVTGGAADGGAEVSGGGDAAVSAGGSAGSLTPDGGLASTGTGAVPVAVAAGMLLVAGAGVYVLARQRRRDTV
ncbi:hypothetical protein ACFV5N_23275 [Streptomyces sp. NPDC059853]|uniref:hypothetical protein n=1 Tax=Streptomyces sp. NPDC059853 TaxID=3346973 RepID=UPI003647AC62